MSTPPEPVPMWNGGALSTPLRPGVPFGGCFVAGCGCDRTARFSLGGDTNRPAPGMLACATGAAQRKAGGEPGRRTRLPGGTTWIEILPTWCRVLPRLATTTISYVPGVRARPPKRPFSRTRFSPRRPRTDFLPATPQLGLGPRTMKTTLAGAVSRKVTVVPRLLGPRVEKRRREARTLPLAADELLLPVADPDEPALCPVLPPEPWCPGAPGGWGSSGAGGAGGRGGGGG